MTHRQTTTGRSQLQRLGCPVKIGVATTSALVALILLHGRCAPSTVRTNGGLAEVREGWDVVIVRVPQRQVLTTLEGGTHDLRPLRFGCVNTNVGSKVLQCVDHIVEELLIGRLSPPVWALLLNVKPNSAIEASVLQVVPQRRGLRDTGGTLGTREHVDVHRVHASIQGIVDVCGSIGIPRARASPATYNSVVVALANKAAKPACGTRIGEVDAAAMPLSAHHTTTVVVIIAVGDAALNVASSWALASDVVSSITIKLVGVLANTLNSRNCARSRRRSDRFGKFSTSSTLDCERKENHTQNKEFVHFWRLQE